MPTPLESLKAKLLSTADTSDLAGLERVLTTLKLITETEKIESDREKVDLDRSRDSLEVENLRRQAHLESARLWLPLTVPAASAVLLAALTLAFQFYQLRSTTALQRATADQASKMQQDNSWDAQWRGAIQTLVDAKTPDAMVAGVTSLAVFSKSDRYREAAHRLALQYLARPQEPNAYRTMVTTAFDRVKLDDLDDLVSLNKVLGDRYTAVFGQLKDSKAKNKRSLQDEEDDLRQNIPFLNSKIVMALKSRPASAAPNLDDLYLFQSDLRGVDFRGSSIRFTTFENSDVTDADFSDVKKFENNNWAGVAWWKAKAIDGYLLSDLKSRFRFKKGSYYAVATNAKDYQDNVGRLDKVHLQLSDSPAQ